MPPRHKICKKNVKITKKTALSAPAGGSIAVLLAINDSIFDKQFYITKGIRTDSKRYLQITKWLPRSQKWPSFVRQISKITQINCTLCSDVGPNGCYIYNQPVCFHGMILAQIYRAQEGILRSQSGSPGHKWPKFVENQYVKTT